MKLILMIALVVTTSLAGCVRLEPDRYLLGGPAVDCSGDATFGAACRNSTFESTRDYDLHYVEFDDQGLQYPASMTGLVPPGGAEFVPQGCEPAAKDCLFGNAWAYQINNLIKRLDQTAAGRAPAGQPILLMVFIHGWQHDARAEDENLASFRDLLTQTALIEESRRRDANSAAVATRRVVGVYIGWRGRSIDVPGLDNLTFWTRKTAAMHVAEGSSRELFARLRGFKCQQNTKALPPAARNCNLPPSGNDAVKVVLIGHSFGGLILYNSLSSSLIETLTRAFDSDDNDNDRYWRFADLAILINPAFEATRYAPLYRISSTAVYPRYEVPLLVTITSTTDDATGTWFKVGRSLDTLFERHADSNEASADRETVGHHAEFITHRLEVVRPQDDARCPGWTLIDRRTQADQVAPIFRRNLGLELQNNQRFFERVGEVRDGLFRMKEQPWVRDFCGGVRLSLTKGPPNSPIWNVSAIGDPALLPNHSDITQPLFISVIRQLFLDTIYRDETANASRATGR